MMRTAQARFTRPADITAYADGDAVANSTTAGSVTPLTFSGVGPGEIVRAGIIKSGVSVTNASFRLHLFSNGTITAANGDNAAFSTNKAANYLGSFDITVGRAFTDGAAGYGVPTSGQGSSMPVVQDLIYGLLEAKGAYTPASAEVFTVALDIRE